MAKGLPWIVLSLYKNNHTIHEICEITKRKEPNIKKYIDLFEKSKAAIDDFVGKSISSVEDMCGIFAAIKGKETKQTK